MRRSVPDNSAGDVEEGMEGLKDINQFFKNRKMRKMEKKEYEKVLSNTHIGREILLEAENNLDSLLSEPEVKANKDVRSFIKQKLSEIMQIRLVLDEGIDVSVTFEIYEKRMMTDAGKKHFERTMIYNKEDLDRIRKFADEKVAECEAKIKEIANAATEGVDIPATESVENKKDLKATKKRIEALEKELNTNKSTCEAINANVKKLQKKSKRDVEALKDVISFNASLATQMVRQTAINAEIAELKGQIDTYKNDVALEKEARREAKNLAKEVNDIVKNSAGITVVYSDAADDIEDLTKDVIAEVKQETPKEGSFWDKAKKLISDATSAISDVCNAQKKMVSVAAESFCLGEDIDMIAEECYIDFLRVLAENTDLEIAEESDTLAIINETLESFENYFGEDAAAIEGLYPVYTSLLDMKTAFEAVSSEEKNIEKEIEIFEKWIKLYSSQAVTNPSPYLEREIKNLKSRIASLKTQLEKKFVIPPSKSTAVANAV